VDEPASFSPDFVVLFVASFASRACTGKRRFIPPDETALLPAANCD
jgi:hypothetical protein